MKNKEIQEKRMKEYFIQATKEILKGEGLKCVNVRNIADKAGYSYATLYNYFRDINDLVFLCVIDFQKECHDYVSQKSSHAAPGTERIKIKAIEYINYFIQYPGIFDLFYLERVGDFGGKENIISLIGSSLDSICQDDWDYCITKKLITRKCAEQTMDQLRYQVIGLMLLYLNRRIPSSYSQFTQNATDLISLVINSNIRDKK